jgi:hypothetical protein
MYNRSMTIEARYTASARGSSPHRNASDVFSGVPGEVCADRNSREFGMSKARKCANPVFVQLENFLFCFYVDPAWLHLTSCVFSAICQSNCGEGRCIAPNSCRCLDGGIRHTCHGNTPTKHVQRKLSYFSVIKCYDSVFVLSL